MEDKSVATRRQMIVVLGMHRSGTSSVAGTLSHLGVELSDRLISPAADNPKGFFEHEDVWRIDHELLRELGSDWDDPAPLPAQWQQSAVTADVRTRLRQVLERDFADATLCAIKDPRMCRLMPLWAELLQDEGFALKVVLVLRRPAEVIASLMQRDHLDAAHAAGMWLRYQLEAERLTRDYPRLVVEYAAMLKDWRAQADRIARVLDVTWPRAPYDAAGDIAAFLDPGLRHHRQMPDVEGLGVPMEPWLESVHQALAGSDHIASDAMDRVADEVDRMDRQAVAYGAALRQRQRQNKRLTDDLNWVDAERQRILEGQADLETSLQWFERNRHQMQENQTHLEKEIERYTREQHTLLEEKHWLDDQLERMQRELQSRQAEQGRLEQELAGVYASRSWRVTRPLRALMHRYHGLRGDAPAPRASAALSPAEAEQAGAGEQDSATRRQLEASLAEATGHRILMATPDVVGPIRNGGIGTAFFALAKTLSEAGHAVTILYTLGDHCEGEHDIQYWVRHYARLGIRFLPLAPNVDEPKLDAPWYCWHAYRLYLWLKSRQTDYDIAYFPEWRGEAYYALQAKQLGLDFEKLALVVVTHSSTAWADSGNYALPPRLDELDLHFMERRVAEMADVVISPSQYMFDWMQHCGWNITAPTHVIQNLMGEAVASADRAATSAPVTEWVFFGRLELRKGLRIFLEALRRMTPEQRNGHAVTFLGKVTVTAEFDPLAMINEALDDWPRPVQVIGDYDRDQALAYLGEPGRLAVIASLVENSPYTVLECLLRRIPFIAADVGGIAELIHAEDRERSLFRPNPGALAGILTGLHAQAYVAPRASVSAQETQQQWLQLQDRICATARDGFKPAVATEPHITVCLVHYDRPHMLRHALESLRHQTYRHFDVVLVDDGSPGEESGRFLDQLEPEFARRQWTIIRQANAYLGAARNTAARHARGDYLLFMDDDNIAKPHELAVFARAARHADADILTTVSDVFSAAAGGEVPEVSRELWIPLGNAPGLGVFRNVFGDANALVRRSVFEDIGGFTEDYGIGHEDWEFFARATLAGASLYLVPEPLFWYRVDPDSMLRSGQSQTDHARSVRPYWQGLPGSVGAALAFALQLQRQPPPAAHAHPSMPAGGSRARRLYARFVALRRESGWRVAIARTFNYIGRSRSAR